MMSDLEQEQRSNARASSQGDDLHRVAQLMTKLKVAGLPRNYELFYEALFGHEPGLTREVLGLPVRPNQLLLDQIGLKYRLVGHCGNVEGAVRQDAEGILKGLTDILSLGLDQKRSFRRSLETIVHSIKEDESRGLRDLLTELDFLSAAATDLLRHEGELSDKINLGIEQIEAAHRTAVKAAGAMLRDRLTHLPNRIAFNNRLAALYEGDSNPRGTALVLADIRQLDAINRDYGQDAGNRILKRLATVFRKTIKKDDFVSRVGGDEFAFFFRDVSAEAARAICERLQVSVANNLVFATDRNGDVSGIELSIGIALSDDVMSPAQLLGQAEVALAAARATPRAQVVLFSPDASRNGPRHAA